MLQLVRPENSLSDKGLHLKCYCLFILLVTLFLNLFLSVDLDSQAASNEVDIFSHCRQRLGVKDKEGQRVTQVFLISIINHNKL